MLFDFHGLLSFSKINIKTMQLKMFFLLESTRSWRWNCITCGSRIIKSQQKTSFIAFMSTSMCDKLIISNQRRRVTRSNPVVVLQLFVTHEECCYSHITKIMFSFFWYFQWNKFCPMRESRSIYFILWISWACYDLLLLMNMINYYHPKW